MPGQQPTGNASFAPTLAPIAATGLPSAIPAADALGQAPSTEAPKPAKKASKPTKGQKAGKRASVANLGECGAFGSHVCSTRAKRLLTRGYCSGADAGMLAAMAEANLEELAEEDEVRSTCPAIAYG